MKKFSTSKRFLALLLAMALVVTGLPSNVWAATIGDMATGDEIGDTGLVDNIDTKNNISWPIRIFDYLNDGMLFEYANASHTGDIPDDEGGAYGGGTPAPQFGGAATVIGNDYTIGATFDEFAFTYIGSDTAYSNELDTSAEGAREVEYSEVEAKNFVDPCYMNLEYVLNQNNDNTKSYVWVSNFARDNEKYYTGEQVRYAVIVYRTNDFYTAGTARFYWAVSDGYYGDSSDAYSDYYYHTQTLGRYGIDITDLSTSTGYGTLNTGYNFTVPKSTDWSYLVVDMKKGDVATYWDNFAASSKVAGIALGFPLNAIGETMDISHIAYFDTEFEAIEFGKDAVAFDNDPGEYLNAHTEYTTGMEVAIERPTTGDYNGMDFSVADNTTGGYDVDTYDTWTATPTWYQYLGYSVGGVKVTEVDNGERSYVSVSNSNNTSDRSIFLWQYSGGGKLYYVTLVYKTTGFTDDQKIGFYVRSSGGGGSNMATTLSGATKSTTLARSEGEWTYVTYAISDFNDGDYNSSTAYTQYGMYLPSCLTGSSNAGKSLDIAMVWLNTDRSKATTYGQQAADYMNGKTTTVSGSYTTTQKKWNTGNNVSFAMLYGGQGGGWSVVNGNGMGGGESTAPSGYYSYGIGKTAWTGAAATVFNSYRTTAATKGYPVSDSIFLLNSWSLIDKDAGETSYAMSELNLGYTLYNYLTSGVMTAGLLESGLTTVTANGKLYRVPNYKEDTIEYIAYLLKSTLVIPVTDADGNYNYNYVKGTANGEQYGYDDNGKPMDFASALRKLLGITFTSGTNYGTISSETAVGDYSQMTDTQKADLIGSFADCKDNINTFVDAAYYLLMNLYVDNSYNQSQDEYGYLVLSHAALENGTSAYVFDGGFTTGNVNETENTDDYRNSSDSAVVYDKETGTIYLSTATSKDKVYFASSTVTTRFPFLPVTDSEGVYAGETKSPYFLDDGNGVMGVTEEGSTFVNRNYNYAISSNGEFVYHEEDGLFFDFEGDDDVYLFINGELVVDVGAAHSITSVEMDVNDYVAWARTTLAALNGYAAGMSDNQFNQVLEDNGLVTIGEDGTVTVVSGKEALVQTYTRAHRLNLTEGGNYSFDFYYMERHGWGANCRIATNIRVTDPSMDIDKTAEQNGEEVSFGGVVVEQDPIEYNFSLTNNGNTKLYNLTFTDNTIGVTLDYTNGLTVKDGMNGVYVMDAWGAALDVQDITAFVTGYENVGTGGTHNKDSQGNYVEAENGEYRYSENTISFANEEALINFLKTLAGEGLQVGDLNAEVTQKGAGLWVDASVTIQGIYYKLTPEQVKAGVFNNVVEVTATSKTDPTDTNSELLRSQADHRVYVSGAPSYYQWAEHDLFVKIQRILTDATKAAGTEGNQMSLYQEFFNKVGEDLSLINYEFCDKVGHTTSYDYVAEGTDKGDNPGYRINYPEPGTQSFYVLMYLKTATRTDLQDGQYAIVRVTIHVADVDDSVFVLDYGLQTEDLDANGELFKNDELFGTSGINIAKLMGITTTAPEYLDVTTATGTDYNRINFTALTLESGHKLYVTGEDGEEDGYYTINLAIPETGKTISYNAYSQSYSLIDVGTVKINAIVPTEWENVYLYFWYDNGMDNGWPGAPMTKDAAGQFSWDIPADVSNIIISNGTDQTNNLKITQGMAATITVENKPEGATNLPATVASVVEDVTMNVKVPEGWGEVYLYYWYTDGTIVNKPFEWPGVQAETVTADGWYSLDSVPGDVNRVIINNGDGGDKQTVDLTVSSGKNTWITLSEADSYNSSVIYDPATFTVTATVPTDWTTVYLYAWDNTNTPVGAGWPGTTMTMVEAGKFTFDTPSNASNIIIHDGNGVQTVDLAVKAGVAAEITLTDLVDGKYNATVAQSDPAATTVTVYAAVPSDWSEAYLVNLDDNSETKMTKGTDGKFSGTIANTVSKISIKNGTDGKQTGAIPVSAVTSMDVTVTARYNAAVAYSASTESYTIHASVPSDWTTAYLYCWDGNGAKPAEWPGTEMTKGTEGLYTGSISTQYTNVIITNGAGAQTVDLVATAGIDNWISLDSTTNSEGKYTASISYGEDAMETGFSFTPTGFMDDLYTLWMAITVHEVDVTPTTFGKEIDISNEVQMYKKVTVLPANVVYYEDCFPAIDYTDDSFNTNNLGAFVNLGNQSVDQDQEYGQDEYYQSDSNTATSAGTLSTIPINKTGVVAEFEFKGTGFELIARTNATDSATIAVKVYKDGTLIKNIPVDTLYDNGNDGGAEGIYQVPIIRVKDMELGTYKVQICGIPNYDFDKYQETGVLEMLPTYLYLDGLRIYQPLSADDSNGYYNDEEQGATFKEIRDLIVNGTVAVVGMDGDTVKLSTGTVTWTENLTGKNYAGVEYTGTEVNSVNDYLTKGPNNEVYLNGDVSDSALVLYVTKTTGATVNNLQIAMHAMDLGLFTGSNSIGMNAEVQYGVLQSDGSYAWKPLVTLVSASEQYYTIDLTDCPVDSTGRIQVAIRVKSGMVSFTSVKYNGLEIPSIGGDATTLKYENGVLVETSTDNTNGGTTEESTEGDTTEVQARGGYAAFYSLSLQMRAPEVSSSVQNSPDVVEPETEEETTEAETEEETTEAETEEETTEAETEEETTEAETEEETTEAETEEETTEAETEEETTEAEPEEETTEAEPEEEATEAETEEETTEADPEVESTEPETEKAPEAEVKPEAKPEIDLTEFVNDLLDFVQLLYAALSDLFKGLWQY